MKMKKLAAMLLAGMMVIGLLAGCSSNTDPTSAPTKPVESQQTPESSTI